MFSVIICSINPVKFAGIKEHYQKLFGTEPFELIGIHNAKSISEGYNRGLAKAKGEFIIFCHDDIEFITPADWLSRLKSHLARFDVIGVAGTTKLMHPLWFYAGPSYIFGQIAHVGGKPDWKEPYCINIYSTPASVVSGIQAMDGLFIAVRREVLDRVRFDEKTFEGFHCYDVDFTFSAYQAGFKLAVACDLPVIHHSDSNFEQDWREEAKKFFLKHGSRLAPIKHQQFNFKCVAAKTKEELMIIMLPPHICREISN